MRQMILADGLDGAPRGAMKLRRFGAVLAGVVATFVLSLGTDVVLHAVGTFPPWGEPMSDGLFGLATAYRLVFAVISGYVTARCAPDRPMTHALALGMVGLGLSLAGAVATWDRGPALGPHWFPIALVVTAIPCAWLGGLLHARSAR